VIQADKASIEEAFTLCLSMVTSKQKLAFQFLKIWYNSFEYPIIHLIPDAPAGQDDYLNEAQTLKAFLCSNKNISCLSSFPRNLEVLPNSSTEHAVKKRDASSPQIYCQDKETSMI
jgi:hypothetical protein